jgi:hypothetical protein
MNNSLMNGEGKEGVRQSEKLTMDWLSDNSQSGLKQKIAKEGEWNEPQDKICINV